MTTPKPKTPRLWIGWVAATSIVNGLRGEAKTKTAVAIDLVVGDGVVATARGTGSKKAYAKAIVVVNLIVRDDVTERFAQTQSQFIVMELVVGDGQLISSRVDGPAGIPVATVAVVSKCAVVYGMEVRIAPNGHTC